MSDLQTSKREGISVVTCLNTIVFVVWSVQERTKDKYDLCILIPFYQIVPLLVFLIPKSFYRLLYSWLQTISRTLTTFLQPHHCKIHQSFLFWRYLRSLAFLVVLLKLFQYRFRKLRIGFIF